MSLEEPDGVRDESTAMLQARHSWEQERNPTVVCQKQDPLAFGTAEELKRDRLWVARRNQVRAVKHLADVEFERDKDQVKEWYTRQVKRRFEWLLDAAARGELVLPDAVATSWGEDSDDTESRKVTQGLYLRDQNVLRQWEGGPYDTHSDHSLWFHSGWDRGMHRPYCYENEDILATVYTYIRVNNFEAVAAVCGKPVGQLPWQLQHYFWKDVLRHHYRGNSILNRLDPAEWSLSDPWGSLNLSIRIAHCKNAIHARRKKLGLPRRKEWEKVERW